MSVITTQATADRLSDLTCDAWRIVAVQARLGDHLVWGYFIPNDEIEVLKRGFHNKTILSVQARDPVGFRLYAKLPTPLPPRRRVA